MALRKRRSGHVAEGGRIVRRDSAKARYAQQLQLILAFVDQVDATSAEGTPIAAPVIDFSSDPRTAEGNVPPPSLSGKEQE
jgi:Asp-tRNA(Asn)/Glu-tRNA(Gln) amidotransferase C subunit